MRFILVVSLLLLICGTALAAVDIKTLPAEEKALLNSTDPWGLAFGDQLTRFDGYFASAKDATFVAGVTHSLVKVWQNKYWFRGDTVPPGEPRMWKTQWGVTGGTVSFQVAVLPRTGAKPAKYTVSMQAPVAGQVYREEFVKLGPAPYPTFQADAWPDPLVPENSVSLTGLNAGIFYVELHIPADFKEKRFTCGVKIAAEGGETAQFTVPVEVVKLNLKPADLSLVAAVSDAGLSDAQFRAMYRMLLEHQMQPLAPGYLAKLWNPERPEAFAAFVQEAMDRGQHVFHISEPDHKLYDFLKAKGWLSNFMIYSNQDEADEATLLKTNIPYAEQMRKQFPGLKIFLAAELLPGIDRATDIVLTDLSSSRYDPRTYKPGKAPVLWHYYCHLPINYQMRAPLVQAPNMQIDNPALEHRLALWMSRYYGAKGVYIWSGNNAWNMLGKDFWQTLQIPNTAGTYPYGGIHHGNGYLVYPPREADGPVRPSLRLKVLRDGLEDLAILAAAEKHKKRLGGLLDPVPAVFTHPQYFDQLPETLLNRREAILKKLRGGEVIILELSGGIPVKPR